MIHPINTATDDTARAIRACYGQCGFDSLLRRGKQGITGVAYLLNDNENDKKKLAIGVSHNPNRKRDMINCGINWGGVCSCICAHFSSAPDLVWIVYDEEESDRRSEACKDD